MKIKIKTFLTVTMIFSGGYACKSTGDRNSTDGFATVFMISGSEAHAESKNSWQAHPGETVFFLRPEKSRTGDAYIVSEREVATGKVLETKSENLMRIQLVSGQAAPGDVITTNKSSGKTAVSYRGTILLCSSPDQIHIFGTANDGLVPKLRLKVLRKYADYDDQYNIIRGEKQVGEIEIIGKAGSNFSKAKLISGKILPGDFVQL